MLIKCLPLAITALSVLLAIVFHYKDKQRFLLPCALAALGTSVFAYLAFYVVLDASQTEENGFPWSGVRFAFLSGFVLAMFVGYLMKYVPKFFLKK